VQQREGLMAVAALARQRVSAAAAFAISAAQARLWGEANRWFVRRHLLGRRSVAIFDARTPQAPAPDRVETAIG